VKRLAACLLTSLAALMGSLAAADVAAADPDEQLRPVDLRVFGDGEDSWYADNDFRLDWDRAPGSEQLAAPVNLRVRNASGGVVVLKTGLPSGKTTISHIHVPPTPGVYTADVWLEGPEGERGPEASTTLRFDNVRPRSARPLAADGWVVGSTPVLVEIEHPAAPQPISGIRGYAVSVDQGPDFPCAGSSRCSVDETDLRGGIEDDTISLGLMREGIHVVRAVAVSGSGMRSEDAGSAIVRVDATLPEVALTGVPQDWASSPVRLTASATDALSGMAASGADGPYTAISIDGGVPRVDPGTSTEAIVTGEGSHRVAFYARDAAGNVGDGTDGNGPPVALVRIDDSPPAVAFARSQDPSDPERIEATISDPLSGADPTRGSIAVRPAGSRQRLQPLATTASAGKLVARWDSEAFPPGSYEFTATGYDTAGNAATSDRRGDGARMVLANPLKTPTEIQAGFGGRRLTWQRCSRVDGRRRCRRDVIESFVSRPTMRAVPYGHGVRFAGRLTSISGSPLGGLPVRVVESFDPGADSPQRTTTVQTAADGTFLARLAPGPSRHVEAVFAGNRVLTASNGGAVRLGTLAGVRMRASATSARVGGAPVIFSGRVGHLGAPIPSAGRPVELQFRIAGREWSEFRTVQTNTRGRFRYPYSFSDDDSRNVRFQFRAYVPAQAGWPYEPAASRPVSVTGH
jgi:hypothetical protein